MENILYILRSKETGKYYIGQTNNLEERLKRHKSGYTAFGRINKNPEVVFTKVFETRSAAIRAEAFLKRQKSRKFIEKIVSGKYIFPPSSVGRAGGCASPLTAGEQTWIEVLLAQKKDKRKYSDRRQYLIKAVYARRKKVRQMAIEYKGGKCELCGYNTCTDALEFHHKDLSKKDFGISEKGYTRSWKRVQQELDKCIMVCANCHREVHASQVQLPRETVVETVG